MRLFVKIKVERKLCPAEPLRQKFSLCEWANFVNPQSNLEEFEQCLNVLESLIENSNASPLKLVSQVHCHKCRLSAVGSSKEFSFHFKKGRQSDQTSRIYWSISVRRIEYYLIIILISPCKRYVVGNEYVYEIRTTKKSSESFYKYFPHCCLYFKLKVHRNQMEMNAKWYASYL